MPPVADLERDTQVKLEDLGTFRWNELSQLKPSPTGVKLKNLDENMWSKSGMSEEREDEKNARKFRVVFDKEYVLDYLHNKVFVPLGINRNGKFNKELLDEILEQAIEYSLDEEKRQEERELLRMSQPFIEENGLTPEQAMDLVKRQREVAEQFLLELSKAK